ARRRELSEVRCALVERRCQDTVARLEEELREAATRTQRCSRCGSGAGGGGSAPSSPPKPRLSSSEASLARTPQREEVLALQGQLELERELHQKHKALYQRYLPELGKAWGRPLPTKEEPEERCSSPAFVAPQMPLLGVRKLAFTDSSKPTRPSPPSDAITPRSVGSGSVSDDEDYTWEGYLERRIAPDQFDK
ncbi:unnamed protein product, partial [Polarella glacialis]